MRESQPESQRESGLTSRPVIQPAPQPLLTPASRPRRRSWWRLAVPLTVQVVLILAIPARSAYVFATGTTVVLQTVPVDPYDLLRGYYQTLSYDISQVDTLQQVPGGQDLFDPSRLSESFPFYVILEPPAAATMPPQPWRPVQVVRERPEQLTARQQVLRGEYRAWQVVYGLETYYMPEAEREAINEDIQTVQRSEPEAFRVEVKVSRDGSAVPVSLWVSDRNYRF